MDLSIIVVSWNTRELLARCLDSLFEYTTGLEWELIVVDNASEDGTPHMILQHYPLVRLIQNRANMGFAAANNVGIKSGKGRHFFLLNSDTEIKSNVPLGLLRFLDCHPDAGAVGCRLIEPSGTPQRYACGGDPTLWRLVARHLGFSPKQSLAGTVRLIDWVSAAALCVRRSALEQVGPLDEQIPMYFEDVDLCLSLRRFGWEVWLVPELEVVHAGGGTPISQDARRSLYFRSLSYFYRKHYGWLQTGLLSVLLITYQIILHVRYGPRRLGPSRRSPEL